MTPEQLTQTFRQQFAHTHTALIRAPGRVNLIGEHTDYNDGFVLPCAIDFATHAAIAPNGSRSVRVYPPIMASATNSRWTRPSPHPTNNGQTTFAA